MEGSSDGPVLQLTADEFAALVWAATDEQIEEGIRAAGADRVLDRIFGEMDQRFLPERAGGTAARFQWIVTDSGEEHPYLMSIAEGRCSTSRGRADDPTVTLTMDLPTFAKLVAGRREGIQLWMLHKLKVDGDPLLAARLNGFFQRPRRPDQG